VGGNQAVLDAEGYASVPTVELTSTVAWFAFKILKRIQRKIHELHRKWKGS
jgi:hypothetical protein